MQFFLIDIDIHV